MTSTTAEAGMLYTSVRYQRVRLPRAFLSVARRLEYRFNQIRRLYCIKIGSQTRPNNLFHIWNLNRTTQEH